MPHEGVKIPWRMVGDFAAADALAELRRVRKAIYNLWRMGLSSGARHAAPSQPEKAIEPAGRACIQTSHTTA